MRILAVLLLVLPLLLLSSCGDDPTAPFPGGVTFTPDKAVYERGETVTVTLYNGSERTVHVWDRGCPWSIEREVDSVWKLHALFVPPVVCTAEAPGTRPLKPGESTQHIIHAQESEQFLEAGRYRSFVNLSPELEGVRTFFGSESFVVEEAP